MRHGFLEPLHPLSEGRQGQAVLAVLLLEPAGAEADLRPARSRSDRPSSRSWQERRVAKGIGRDHQPAADPPGLGEERGEHGPALVLGQRDVVLVQEVVVAPGGVEAEAVGLEPGLPHLGIRAAHLGHLDSKAQRSRGHGLLLHDGRGIVARARRQRCVASLTAFFARGVYERSMARILARDLIRQGVSTSRALMSHQDKIWSRYSRDKVDIGETLARVLRTLSKALPLDLPLRALSVGSSTEPQFPHPRGKLSRGDSTCSTSSEPRWPSSTSGSGARR
jgi:hypothetical protein